jgi:uncharacterized protein (TIGR01244 family)
MPHVVHITDDFAVARALGAEDFAEIAAQGFRTVLNFLPDGETKSQLSSDDARHHCEKIGMAYAHVPAQKYSLFTDGVVTPARQAMAALQGPVLAYCSSGQRAAIVWAAVNAQSMPVDTVLGTLTKAGFDFGYIRDDLEQQADRPRWQVAVENPGQDQVALPCA